MIENIDPEQLATPQGFSHITIAPAGRIAFISGQVSYNSRGEIVGVDDISAQTAQVFENLNHALTAISATFKNVLKFTFYVKNLDQNTIHEIRRVRAQYLDASCLPASTMVGVIELARPDLLLEVEAFVLLPN